jgi:hypothetical protein
LWKKGEGREGKGKEGKSGEGPWCARGAGYWRRAEVFREIFGFAYANDLCGQSAELETGSAELTRNCDGILDI